MPLSVGTKFDHYEVISLLGQGGMGEVYRARDTTLKRDVALKVLPATFLRDPDRMARFQREAQVLASLDHPNIGHIHGIVDSEDSRGLVLALIEGPTLADRIEAGPIPLDEAVAISKQIIEALEYAHDRGVVHRDLKPANIKITSDGVVKVLDFGLAKVLEDEPPPSSLANSPTLTLGHTRTGVILGTAAYMSPEQAVGRPVDRRSDIFSFGAVLYEMLTGKRAFTGATTPDVLEAVVKNDPDWSALPAGTPGYLRRLLERMLAKDRKQRLQAIGEARIALENPRADEPSAVPVPAASPSRFGWVAWAVAGLLLITTLAVAFVHLREAPPEIPLITTSIAAPETTAFDFGAAYNPPAVSPDGKRMVFGARGADNKTALWMRPLASPTAQMLAGTEGATFPFWSPDSRYVGFFAGDKLKKIDVSGGPALAIADAPAGRGGSWSAEDVIVFAPANASALMRVAASGGDATPVTSIDATKSRAHKFPWFLSDARHFLFEDQLANASADAILRVGSLDSQASTILGHADSNAVYSAGFLLFLRGSTLMAQPFDEKKLAIQGEAVPVAEQVGHVLGGGREGLFTASASGLLVYGSDGASGRQILTWFDRSGKAVGALGGPGDFYDLEISPDGKAAAVSTVDSATNNVDIWIYDIARNLRTRFTFDSGVDRQAVWSPDGSAIVFASRRDSGFGLYRKSADGKGNEELLYKDSSVRDATSWSTDGKRLMFDVSRTSTVTNMRVLPLLPEKPGRPLQPQPFHESPFTEEGGTFSPDGQWVAYASNESRRPEIYVAPFPGPGGKRQISIAGGLYPRWRHDGKEIFYVGLDGRLMAAEANLNGGRIDVGQVHSLGIAVVRRGIPYDVSLDGQRFLVISEGQRAAAPPLTLIENWPVLLKK